MRSGSSPSRTHDPGCPSTPGRPGGGPRPPNAGWRARGHRGASSPDAACPRRIPTSTHGALGEGRTDVRGQPRTPLPARPLHSPPGGLAVCRSGRRRPRVAITTRARRDDQRPRSLSAPARFRPSSRPTLIPCRFVPRRERPRGIAHVLVASCAESDAGRIVGMAAVGPVRADDLDATTVGEVTAIYVGAGCVGTRPRARADDRRPRLPEFAGIHRSGPLGPRHQRTRSVVLRTGWMVSSTVPRRVDSGFGAPISRRSATASTSARGDRFEGR